MACGVWQCSPTTMRLAETFLVFSLVVGLMFIAYGVIEWRKSRAAHRESVRLLYSAQEHLREIERQAGLPSSFEEDDEETPQVH